MDTLKPMVNLDEFAGLGLILLHPSGVLFTNQVAGFVCMHPEVEGVFVPLPERVGRPEVHALRAHFRGNWHTLTEEDAKVVDGIFRSSQLGFLRVDRARLADSYEAWVYVVVDHPQQDRAMDLFHGFTTRAGIVTWMNSD